MTLPKLPLVASVIGLSQLMRLKALYDSARASIRTRSVMWNDLLIVMSVCQVVGPTSPGNVQGLSRRWRLTGSVASVEVGSAWNFDVSNQKPLGPFVVLLIR